MEKIYMEEQNQYNKKNKKKRIQSSTSILMSYILAFVTIISIVAYGFGKVSFAIPDESETPFPSSFTTGALGDRVKGLSSISIPLYKKADGSPIYCIESEVNILSGAEYTKDQVITDNGLLFLFTYLSSSTYKLKGNGADLSAPVKNWVIQSAIWVYQTEIGAPKSGGIMSTAEATKLRAETKLVQGDSGTDIIYTSAGPIYDNVTLEGSDLASGNNTITKIIEKAKNIHAGRESWNAYQMVVSLKSNTISLTDDEKYYQSDVVTVGSKLDKNAKLLGYKIDTSRLPEGSKIFLTSGEEMTTFDNLTTGTQFVVRVPVDKITNENKNVSIEVTGSFQADIAYKYVSTGSQSVAYAGNVIKQHKAGVPISFNYTPPTPDTGIGVAQSIYFIGLIILLAGVGIIYANIKPKAQQQ